MSYYKHTIEFTPLDAEKEIELFKRWKDDEDFGARDEIIQAHLRFALSEGLKAGRGRFAEEDIVSAANLGLLKATYKFDPEKAKARGARFAAFARKLIRGQVGELFRAEKQNTVSIEGFLNHDVPSNPSDSNLGKARGINKLSYIPITDETPASVFEDEDFRKVWSERAYAAMSKLPKSHQTLLRQVLLEGRSLAEVGRMQNPPVTRAAVRLRYRRAITRLKAIVATYVD